MASFLIPLYILFSRVYIGVELDLVLVLGGYGIYSWWNQ